MMGSTRAACEASAALSAAAPRWALGRRAHPPHPRKAVGLHNCCRSRPGPLHPTATSYAPTCNVRLLGVEEDGFPRPRPHSPGRQRHAHLQPEEGGVRCGMRRANARCVEAVQAAGEVGDPEQQSPRGLRGSSRSGHRVKNKNEVTHTKINNGSPAPWRPPARRGRRRRWPAPRCTWRPRSPGTQTSCCSAPPVRQG